MNSKIFCPMVPVIEILGDERMTDGMLRVLLSLLQFADKDGNCHPTSEQLAALTRMHPVSVRKATAALLRAGWIEKTGKGGRGAAASYRVNRHPYRSPTATDNAIYSSPTATDNAIYRSPTATETEQKEPENCSPTITKTVAGTATVSAPPIVKEHTNNIPVPAPDKLEREARATRAPARNPAVPPCPDDVPAELYAEWLDYRRAAGTKPLWSERAEALMRCGAKRAGISLAKAMEYTMARTWKGFYPITYLRDEKPQHNGGRQFRTAAEIDAENNAIWFGNTKP